jgi:hypothetical protein
MTRKTPLFITASLRLATLSLALPDLEFDVAAEETVTGETVKGSTRPGPAIAPQRASSPEENS